MSKEITKSEKDSLKEKFVREYSKTKGWNPDKLSTNQMFEILSKPGYKSPR